MKRSHPPDKIRQWNRNALGAAQLTEFGAALFLLISCVIVPLIDLSVMQLRWGLSKSIVGNRVHQLAQCDTLSEAMKSFGSDSTFYDSMKRIGGVTLKSSQLSLSATPVRHPDEMRMVEKAGELTSDWLPGGQRGPCVYQLSLTVTAAIEPLITANIPSLNVPGLTQPLTIQLHDVSAWENLSRDPITGEFFMNE